MAILLAFLLIVLFAGLGYSPHFPWIVAVAPFVLWLMGFALHRGECAQRNRFYRW